ncbi:MAG: hypothetical protein QXZ17_01035 [Nitrososphaerota archaeon]
MTQSKKEKKVLRRVLKIGDSAGVTIPKEFLNAEFVWIISTGDGDIIVRPARVA